MSYESYEQVFCENGHYSTRSCLEAENVCPKCGAPISVVNQVDETMGESYGVIPDYILDTLKVSDEVVETCDLGHKHVTSPPVYQLPKDIGPLRHFYDHGLGMHVPLTSLEEKFVWKANVTEFSLAEKEKHRAELFVNNMIVAHDLNSSEQSFSVFFTFHWGGIGPSVEVEVKNWATGESWTKDVTDYGSW